MNYPKGTKVKITMEGIVSNPSSVPDRFIYVKPVTGDRAKPGESLEGLRIDLHSKVTIEEIVPEFDPKPGEIYTVTPVNSGIATTWFVTMESGKIKMASLAGVFSLFSFKDVYLERGKTDFRVAKAEIK